MGNRPYSTRKNYPSWTLDRAITHLIGMNRNMSHYLQNLMEINSDTDMLVPTSPRPAPAHAHTRDYNRM